jgi:hypothetical protein
MAWPLSQNGQVDRYNSTHQPLACQIVQHKNYAVLLFVSKQFVIATNHQHEGSETFSALVRFCIHCKGFQHQQPCQTWMSV